MSLINDALKKAQTDVVRGTPPNPMAGSFAGAHVRPQKQSPFLKLGICALFLAAGVWAVSLFLGSSDEPIAVMEVATAAPTTALEAAPEVAAVPSEPVVAVAPNTPVATESLQAPSATEAQTVEVAPALAEISTPVVSAPAQPAPTPISNPAPTATPEPAAPVVVEAAPAATAPAVPPEAQAVEAAPKPATAQGVKDEIIYTLKQLEITAVMGDGNKARIMSGGQIHRAGELINLDLKIRFQGKKAKTLFFTDAAGEVYEKAL
ncbi:hypothetical protein N9C83_02770 [Opitutales bacterium]|jgi:hypothetical protein|nr:hypothetical protein [Opitutales bacterium]